MNCWMILEMYGHVKHIGYVTEVDAFGGKLGKIETLERDGSSKTIYFGGSSVYRLTPVTEEEARELAKPWEARYTKVLPSSWEEETQDINEEVSATIDITDLVNRLDADENFKPTDVNNIGQAVCIDCLKAIPDDQVRCADCEPKASANKFGCYRCEGSDPFMENDFTLSDSCAQEITKRVKG